MLRIAIFRHVLSDFTAPKAGDYIVLSGGNVRAEAVFMSPINRFCIFLLKLYKKYLSKGLNSGCIFTPTCSVYAMEALGKYNFFKAFYLIITRILRCNSLNPGGYDPPDDPQVKKWLY